MTQESAAQDGMIMDRCPNCGHWERLPPEKAGYLYSCKRCKKTHSAEDRSADHEAWQKLAPAYHVTCPHCHGASEFSRDAFGQDVECPRCQGFIQLPGFVALAAQMARQDRVALPPERIDSMVQHEVRREQTYRETLASNPLYQLRITSWFVIGVRIVAVLLIFWLIGFGITAFAIPAAMQYFFPGS